MYTVDHAKRRSLRKWAKISGVALGLAFVGVFISAVVSSREAQTVRSETAYRAQLYRFNGKLRGLLTLITDAETGQRGYLLTDRALYLRPYRTAVSSAPPLLEGLAMQPLPDPVLAAHVRTLRGLAARKLAELAETIRLRDSGNRSAALALVQTDVGEQATEGIRTEVAFSAAIVQTAIDECDVKVVQATAAGERFEGITLVTLMFCGLFAAMQIGGLLLTQREYEERLGASERRHRAIVEDQTELIAISLVDGALEFINPAYERFFAVPAAQLEGRSLYDFLSEEEGQDWRERMALVLKSDDCLLRTQRVPAGGGHKVRWISWRHRAQRSPTGEVRIHSVGRDITVNKIAEEELKARENFLAHIGRVAGVGGWSLDLRSGVVQWSPVTRKIHGVSDHYQPTEESALSFYPPKSQVLLRQAVDGAMEHGTQYDLEIPMNTAAGRSIWVRVVGEAEFDEHGNATRVVGALQDITERKAIERSLRELTEVFDHTPDFVAQTDWRGFVTFLNPAARAATGIGQRDAIAGRTYGEFYPQETNEQFLNEILPQVKDKGVWVGESQVMLKDGRTVPINHMVIGHRDAVGRMARYTSLMRDIGLESRNRQELARKTSTLNSIVDAIPAMLAVWDRNLRYQLVNRAFENWRAAGRDQLIGQTMEQAMGAKEFEQNVLSVERVLGGENVVFERSYPQARDCRHMSVSYTPLRTAGGEVDGFVELRQDITQSREERKRLVDLSEHDPLTGLLNRAGFEGYLIEKLGRGEGASLAVLYIDLDHFKPVNDQYGHATGDEVLRQFALRLRATVRPVDAVARLGGDEFGIVLLGVHGHNHAADVADNVVAAALQPFEVTGKVLHLSGSVGVAYNAELSGGWKGLLARADAKVYEAKDCGRNRYVLSEFGEATDGDIGDRRVV